MEFRQMVINALDKHVESGLVEKCVEEQVAKTIKEIVSDQLRAYSNFGEQLKVAVKESLALNGSLDLPAYNDALLKIVRLQLETYTRDCLEKQVAQNLTKLLEPPPAEIKLSQLVEMYRQRVKEKLQGGCYCHGETGILFRRKDHDSGFVYVDLHDEPKPKKDGLLFSADIRLGIHRDVLFSLSFGNRDIEKELFVGEFHGFERMLFQMKAAKTRIVVDCHEGDVETYIELAEV